MNVFPRISKHGLKRLLGARAQRPGSGKSRVLFVSHEATRTGAPLIILNLLRAFKNLCEIQCESILHNGGQLTEEFAKVSEVDCLNLPRKPSEDIKKAVQRVIQRERDNKPLLAICNSMESRFIAEEIAAAGIPIIFLVHELPSSYTEEDYDNVVRYSNRIIFPAEAVSDAARRKTIIPESKIAVMPQGLLKPGFGEGVILDQARRQIRDELRIPQDSFVVLGCGTLDLRKGIDHFSNIAREMIKNDSGRPTHFVWLGDGPRWIHSPYHYVSLDLDSSGCASHVHFIGERPNVEPYFVGSDAFLLTSRVDPFPCVIHEAMAAGLPVLTFAGNGGASEAISGGCGLTLPYANYSEMANALRLLKTQPNLVQSLSEKSREKVKAKYCFGTYADAIIEMAESVSQTNMRLRPRIYQESRAA